jgi:hypothetical protein
MGDVDLNVFNRTLGEMISRASNPQKPLTEIGVIMISQQQENIRVGGRPEQWQESERARKQGGQTLLDTGTLMHSFAFEVGEGSVAAGPTAVGKNHITDPRVFRLLAFGGDVQRFARSETFVRNRKQSGRFAKGTTAGRGMTFGEHIAHYPQRDFTYIAPEAFATFGDVMKRFLVEGR